MSNDLTLAREKLIQEMGRLSAFAGFNKAMGQIYGLLYLSPEPVSLGDIADQLGISKGNASLNIKTMQRWGLVRPVDRKGDRRDFYLAETDFWKIVQDILHERDKKEIDRTLAGLQAILSSLKTGQDSAKNTEYQFYRQRLSDMLEFGEAVNQIMKAMLTMNDVRMQSLSRGAITKDKSRRIAIEE
jgi:DNA-binding transcriptional regulator GbsR (MarR family)